MSYSDGTTAAIPVSTIIDLCDKELKSIDDTRAERREKRIAFLRTKFLARHFYKNVTDDKLLSIYNSWGDGLWLEYGWTWEDDVRRIRNLALAAKKSSTIMMISSRDYSIIK